MNVNLDLLRTSPTTALTKSYLAEAALQLLHEQDAAIAAAVAAETERCAKIVIGWRESDWPEGFDRRTAEIVCNDRAAAIRANGSQ